MTDPKHMTDPKKSWLRKRASKLTNEDVRTNNFKEAADTVLAKYPKLLQAEFQDAVKLRDDLVAAFAEHFNGGIEVCVDDVKEDYCEFADQAVKRFRRLKAKP